MPSLKNTFSGEPTDPYGISKEIFNLEQVYLQIGDQHERISAILNLPLLDPSSRLDQKTTFQLALVTTFQFAETIPDPIAAESTMSRRDWKVALHLPIKHPGFSACSLCKFRESLFSSSMAMQEFKQLLDYVGKIGLYAREKNEGLDPNDAISTICVITRYYRLNQVIKTALSYLVSSHSDWLRANALPYWYERYKTRRNIPPVFSSWEDMQEEAVRIGKDMQHLLAVLNEHKLKNMTDRIEIRELDQLLKAEFDISGDSIRWRQQNCATCICNTL